MTRELLPERYPQPVRDVVATALGVAHRADPHDGRGGGPAGNARFTAWVGLVLLVAFFAEGVTLLSVRGMISAHIVIGVVLVPLALLKTATTGWRILRYYTGSAAYREAGPPPLVLRVLGPLVILTALAVLGSGLALIALGPDGTYRPLLTVGPFEVNALTLHQASFIGWLVATGLHVLARTIPALLLVRPRTPARRHLGGGAVRAGIIALMLVVGVGAAVVVLHASGSWTQGHGFVGFDDGEG